jgi:hypothetical protein
MHEAEMQANVISRDRAVEGWEAVEEVDLEA